MSQGKSRVALIVGVTGIGGINLARAMLSTDSYGQWLVYGISRKRATYLPPGIRHISCDLTDATVCASSLRVLGDVTHVFYTTWAKCSSEEENCSVNGTMLRNLFQYLPATVRIQHFVLLTGLKHYIGPFGSESYSEKQGHPVTPYRESLPRQPGVNFYYTLEDIVFEKAREMRFTWSVARPNAIIGFGLGQMSMGVSIAVYASICKYANKPFVFPGNATYYDVVAEVTDARVLSQHMLWQAVTPSAANQAFNVVNGSVFRWRQMWHAIAEYFKLDVPEHPGHPTNISAQLEELAPVWEEMKEKFDLQPLGLSEMSTFWLLDVSFNKVADYFTDMTKSRELGFLTYQNSEKSFTDLFDHLRENKYIP